MNQRDKLIELIDHEQNMGVFYDVDTSRELYVTNSNLADHLLDNGVVVLPCKVTDTVYDISWNQRVRDCKISTIYQEADGTWKMRISPFCGGVYDIKVDAIGKTRFLTRAEAEKALEGLKNEI